MSSIFVIVYPQQQFNVSATLRHNGWDSAQSAPATQQGQADPHFVGRFRGATFARVAYQPAADTQPANEANPHFAPRFRLQAFARPVNSWDTGESTQQFPPEANPHFLGKFRQSTPARPIITWDSSASASPVQQGQPDPHFIGQFNSPPLFMLRGFAPAADVPIVAVVDANPHYVGRFTPTQLSRPVSAWETGINPPSPVQQGQPDPHFIGKFRNPSLFRIRGFAPATDAPIVSIVDTNPHFVGGFRNVRLARLALDLHWDTLIPPAGGGNARELPPPRFVVYDSATGNAVSGGFVYTFSPSGSTQKITWQDAGETTQNYNPITLDSAGSALLYGGGTYQLTVTDPIGNAMPGYSGISYSPAFISSALSPVFNAASLSDAFSLLAASGGVIGSDLTVLGNTAVSGEVTLGEPLAASSGGSGVRALAANAILLGEGTSSLGPLYPGASGNIATSNGAQWVTAPPVVPSPAQIRRQIFISTGTWTCPSSVSRVRAMVIAGGGGGSFASACCVITDYQGGWGGVSVGEYTVAAGTEYAVTVGAGGVGSSGGSASSGGASSFASFLSATGGVGATSAGDGADGVGASGTIRNAAAANASDIFGGLASGAAGLPAYPWGIGSSAASGIGGNGTFGGVSGLVYLMWVG